jgi:peptide deformylase
MDWKPKLAPYRTFKKEVWKNCVLVSDFIYQIGEYPELREKSKEVSLEKISEKVVQEKFAYLKKCLVNYRELTGYGRGITAVQVGIPECFSVIFFNNELLLVVNPRIIKTSKKRYLYPEMCMSANPIIAPTIRPAWIEFTYYDEKGKEKVWNMKDDTEIGKMMNRVFQHEIDHMEGIINIDRVSLSKELILQSDPTFYDSAKFVEV